MAQSSGNKKSKSKKIIKSTKKLNYPDLSIVIPCYNEAKRIDGLVAALDKFQSKWENDLEVILVNDGSSDKTKDQLEKATSNSSSKINYELINFEQNAGKGAALKAGVEKSSKSFILTMDADLATHPNELINWLSILPSRKFSSNNIYIASREHRRSDSESPFSRKVSGNIFNFIIQLFTGLELNDTQCGFKLYPKSIAKNLFGRCKTDGWAHDVEILMDGKHQGHSIKPMPIKWEHQDNSKIALFKDGASMFAQSALIASRLNFRHFITDPISDIRTKNINGKDPSYYRLAFKIVAVILFFLMPILSFDFGITGDEIVQKEYGEKVLSYITSGGENTEALTYKNLYYYGGLFDTIAAATNKYIGIFDTYDTRHILNALFGFILMLFTGFLAKELDGSWRTGFFALILIALSPRIFGHSMNNPKDIPFALFFIMGVLYSLKFVRQLPVIYSKTLILLIISIAGAINIRVGGILLLAYLGLFTGVAFFWKKDLRRSITNFKITGKVAIAIGTVCVLGFFLGMLFWPYGLQEPLKNPFKALSEMSNFSTSIRMLFEEQHLWSDELPWYYIPKWIFITSPIIVLLGIATSIYAAITNSKKLLPFSLLTFAAVFPVAYAVYKQSSLYDGMRHFIFIYPILIVLAAWGWSKIMTADWLGKIHRPVIGSVMGILLLLPSYWMIKNHPNQYLYFNEIFGGADKAYGAYETDYWMNSVKETADWLIENEQAAKSGEELRIYTNCYYPLAEYFKRKAPHLKADYVKYDSRNSVKGDYYIWISRFVNKDLINNEAWPPQNVLHTVTADGVPLSVLTKDSGDELFEASQAEKRKDIPKAISLYSSLVEREPKNESALLGLASAAVNSNDLNAGKTALDKLVKLCPSDIRVQNLLGIYHLKTNDFTQAATAFEKCNKINYKFPTPYYYLAVIYNQQKNLDKALEKGLQVIKYAPNTKEAYNLIATIYDQKGDAASAKRYRDAGSKL